MCAAVRGPGRASDIDIDALCRPRASRSTRAPSPFPGFTVGRLVRPGSSRTRASSIRQAAPRLHRGGVASDFLYRARPRSRSSGINLTYEGLVPKIQKSLPVKDVESLQPHIRAAVDRIARSAPAPTAAAPGSTRRRDRRRSTASQHRRCLRRCRSATWPSGSAGSTRRGAGRCSTHARGVLDSFVQIGLGYLSLDRESSGRCPAARPSGRRMVRHLGSALTDVTYVFDEPTIGLHAHDVRADERRSCGGCATRATRSSWSSTTPEVIADRRPRRRHGSRRRTPRREVVFEGTVDGPRRRPARSPGRHLDVRQRAEASRRAPTGSIPIRNARLHNLEDVSVDVPARRARRRDRRRRAPARARSSTAACPGPIRRSRSSTSPRSAARGARTRRRTRASSTRSGRRSRRRTASSPRCSARTPRARARTATASA